MIRTLKTLGLALVAVFAISAMVASAAMALTPVLTTTNATKIDARTAPGSPGVFNRLGRTISCNKAEFNAPASNLATTFTTAVPVFAECESPSLKKPATVFMNECDFTFHLTADAKEGGEDTWTAVSDLNCPETKTVTIVVYTDATHATALCTFHIATQTGKTKIDLTNEPAGSSFGGVTTSENWVLAHIEIGGIVSTATGSILTCGAASDSNATLSATAEVYGTTSGGLPAGITISTH